MNFYVDFEATQFSGHIIQIGCVNENGQQFQSLVKPPEGEKITEFITNLTGITNEMLAEAPSADDVFIDLMNFIGSNSDNNPPQYFCYGDTDAGFVKKTLKHMSNPYACMMAQAMSANLIDYSRDVKTFFVSPNKIALRKVYNLIKEEENEQHHDALEDAMMLAEVVSKMKKNCRPEDNAVLSAMPNQSKPKGKKSPKMFLEWPADKWEADTRANPNNWQICCYTTDGAKVKYFDTLDTATLWAIKYITKGRSPKRQSDIDCVAKSIMKSVENGTRYCGFKWSAWTQAENADPYVRDKEENNA